MRRRLLQLALVGWMLSLLQAGCSLALKLDADCDKVSDCGAYTCDAQNIACRHSCEHQDECADTYVCDRQTGTCEGGYCVPTSPVAELGEPIQGFQAARAMLVSPDGGTAQLVVLAGQPQGIGLRRYYLPNFLPATDEHDPILGAMRVDSSLQSTLQLTTSLQDTAKGIARFAWARQGEGAGVRSALLDVKTPWLSATETVYNLPAVAVLSQLTSLRAASGTLFAWVESSGADLHPIAQFIGEDGVISMAQMLDESGYAIVLAGGGARSVAFWLQRSGTWWGIRSRESRSGHLFDIESEAALVDSGNGSAPSALYAANGDNGTLLFTEKQNTLGERIYEAMLIEAGRVVRRNLQFAEGFSEIERFQVFSSKDTGAWVAIVGRWDGEAGLWLRYVDGRSVVDRYPIRVFTGERDVRIDQLSVSQVGDALQVTWAERGPDQAQRQLVTRSFQCR